MINSSFQLSNSPRLELTYISPDHCVESSLTTVVNSVLTVLQIYYLEILKTSVSIDTLIQMIKVLL
jgi:hypothetical protein